MAYSDPYTFIPLQPLLASQLNGLSDDIRALWPYTGAGQIAYATSATGLAALALGTAGQGLRVNSAGTGLEWSGGQMTRVYASVNISIASGAVITWNSETVDDGTWHSTSSNTSRITPGVAGRYRATAYIKHSSATNYFFYTVAFRVAGSTYVAKDVRTTGSDVPNEVVISCPLILTASDYVEVYIENNAGASLTVTGGATGSWFALERM